MTQEERIELLRKVAEVAPKEMKAEYAEAGKYSEVECVLLMGCHESPLYLHLDPEYKDGEAIIAMLDAMEGAGWAAYAGSEADDNGVRIPGYYCCCYDTNDCESLECKGETRAEAVARAFVEVFEVKP